jgi:AcrR family transcriptional regulator
VHTGTQRSTKGVPEGMSGAPLSRAWATRRPASPWSHLCVATFEAHEVSRTGGDALALHSVSLKSGSDLDGAPPATDGRTLRRDRNRLAVLDSAIVLFAETGLIPDREDIAERSGVSTKSIRRYFGDDDELLRAVIEHEMKVGLPRYRIHQLGKGSLDVRIRRFVGVRCQAHEDLWGMVRAAIPMAVRNPYIRQTFDAMRMQLAEQVDRQFAVELASLPEDTARARSAMIDAICQFEAIDQLRGPLQWSKEDTADALEKTIRHLLEPATNRT